MICLATCEIVVSAAAVWSLLVGVDRDSDERRGQAVAGSRADGTVIDKRRQWLLLAVHEHAFARKRHADTEEQLLRRVLLQHAVPRENRSRSA